LLGKEDGCAILSEKTGLEVGYPWDIAVNGEPRVVGGGDLGERGDSQAEGMDVGKE